MVYYLLVGGGKCFFVAESVIENTDKSHFTKDKGHTQEVVAKVQKKLIYQREKFVYGRTKVHKTKF